MKQLLVISLLLLVVSLSSFAQDSTATIHFYRTRSIKGAAITYKVHYNETVVGQMDLGTIYTIQVKPGANKFTAKTAGDDFIIVNAKPGEVYYVKCTLAFGVVVGRPKFVIVTKEEGEADIAKIQSKNKK